MDKRPNILLLFTDQQRYDTIGACGNAHMVTPALDRMVREGCWFSSAYSPNPVCVPARHNLITGLPARFHGYADNASHPLDHRLPVLPRILSDNGYDTRAVGKMHFRPVRRHNGFAKMELMEEIPHYREDDEYAAYLKSAGLGGIQNIHGVRNLLYMLPQRSLIPEEHHGSTWVADRSIRYLRDNGGRRPFFLWASWIAPHPPFDVPDGFADMYNNASIPGPRAAGTPVSAAAGQSRRFADFPPGDEDRLIDRMRRLYYGAVSLVDKNIGRVLETLEEIGELDNTFILFASDHGEMLGDYGCYQKMLPYDSCARIPLIVRYPACFPPGSVREEFVDLNDILPTILQLSGIPYPGCLELPGGSLLKNAHPAKNRRRQYMEYGSGASRWISMRDERYKFNYYYAGGEEELFDLKSEAGESRNLLHRSTGAEDSAAREAREKLRAELCRHESRWGLEDYCRSGDLLKMPRPERPGKARRNNQFPVFPRNLASEEERRSMNDFGDEVLRAVRGEPLVRLGSLDLESWEENGAPPELAARIREESRPGGR